MKRSYIGLALGALVAVGAVLSLPSCGHDQKLVSITIQPGTFTFLTQAGTEQFTATGTYIHPPATKDVTSKATWKVDDGVVHMNAGLVTPDPLLGCGGGTISASLPGGISCPGTCIATYNVNSSVLLTASNGVFVSWQNCPQESGNMCPVTIPTGGAAVVATFQ